MVDAARPGSSADAPQQLGRVIGMVKTWVERCGEIWVEAQVIELRRRASPTQFLTLRDKLANASATITCSAAVLDAAGPVTEGSTVVARLTPRVWAEKASLTFECAELRIAGEGRLLAQLEALKRKLQAEGLFDQRRHQPLPVLPRGIGLITAKDSAAERDVRSNVALRWPAAHLVVRYALMQGQSCAEEVMRRLAELDADPQVDVIIIARGGGSLEDLLPFSDEGLVRAVSAARTPVISAIGHEQDHPILDLVADLRASTPTDAAKRVVPDAAEEAQQISGSLTRLRFAITARLRDEQQQLNQLTSRPVLRNPVASFAPHFEQLDASRHRLSMAIDRALYHEQAGLDSAMGRVRAMSPKATLERGYAILADANNGSVTSIHHTEPGDQLIAYLADGRLILEVDDVLDPNKEIR